MCDTRWHQLLPLWKAGASQSRWRPSRRWRLKASWLIWGWPPPHGKEQQNSHGRWNSWAGATWCVLSTAWCSSQWFVLERESSAPASVISPVLDKQLLSLPQGNPKITTAASPRQERKSFCLGKNQASHEKIMPHRPLKNLGRELLKNIHAKQKTAFPRPHTHKVLGLQGLKDTGTLSGKRAEDIWIHCHNKSLQGSKVQGAHSSVELCVSHSQGQHKRHRQQLQE